MKRFWSHHRSDLVVYPRTEDDVAGIVKAALSANAVVIPFGGGTNISGSLEAPRAEQRPVIVHDEDTRIVISARFR